MRIKITLAYVGTAYAGWQKQNNAPTVQGAVEAVAAGLADLPVTVYGAGRTDAGVHARGQVAHFESEKDWPPEEWQRALNALLPADIRVVNAVQSSPRFHARHSARGKTYTYQLDTGSVASPFLAPYVWHVGPDLDLAALRAGAAALLGPLDQRAFATQPEPGERTERPLSSVEIEETADTLRVTIRGRSFLRYAVRGMVGTVVEVARGRRAAESIRTVAESGDRTLAGATAPPHGLCLEHVHYEGTD
jgi:tRNA pseudouridine38-40 synthase